MFTTASKRRALCFEDKLLKNLRVKEMVQRAEKWLFKRHYLAPWRYLYIQIWCKLCCHNNQRTENYCYSYCPFLFSHTNRTVTYWLYLAHARNSQVSPLWVHGVVHLGNSFTFNGKEVISLKWADSYQIWSCSSAHQKENQRLYIKTINHLYLEESSNTCSSRGSFFKLTAVQASTWKGIFVCLQRLKLK